MSRSLHPLVAFGCLALACGAAQALDDAAGRDWRPLLETQSHTSRPSWEQVAAVCAADGTTACTGRLGAIPMKGWVWATREQVRELFGRWTPEFGTAGTNLVSGPQWQSLAAQFQAQFGVTYALKGCSTYQPCFNFANTTGMTATAEPGLSPAVPWGAQVQVDIEWGSGSFYLFQPMHPDVGRGLWMWRPTGLGTPRVYANDDEVTLKVSAGGVALANVLANDWASGQRATLANVGLSQRAASSASISLDATTGAVLMAAGAAAGSHTLDYRICNLADATQCSDAKVTVDVGSFTIIARPDVGAANMALGGTAIASVLGNDQVGSATASSTQVVLSEVSSTHPGVVLNTSTGAVQVAAGTPNAQQVVNYRICERARPANCAQSTATVAPPAVNAVADSARARSKVASTPVPNVLINDTVGGEPATLSNVTIGLVSKTPATNRVQLNTFTGAISVTSRASSGVYQIVYRICQIENPTHCGTATVTLELSGKD